MLITYVYLALQGYSRPSPLVEGVVCYVVLVSEGK